MDIIAYVARLRGLIDRYGWAVQCVTGDEDGPPFAYTVGLAAHSHPEIIVVGLDAVLSTQLLNNLGRRVVNRGVCLAAGRLDDVIERLPVTLIVCDASEVRSRFVFANHVHGTAVDALQLVWPDPNGLFPWDAGYILPAHLQPVLSAARS